MIASGWPSVQTVSFTIWLRDSRWAEGAVIGLFLVRLATPVERQKVDQAVHVGLLVVVHRHVAARRAMEVCATREGACHLFHVGRVHRVVLGANNERGHLDVMEVGAAVPVDQLSGRAELAGVLHRGVDGLVDVVERSHYRIWPL